MKHTYNKNVITGLYSINDGRCPVYEAQFTFAEARRAVACLNADDSLTWDQMRDYVKGRTKVKPYTARNQTKQQAIKMDDERWQRLQAIAEDIITTPIPTKTKINSKWQLGEMLRQIADGKLGVVRNED